SWICEVVSMARRSSRPQMAPQRPPNRPLIPLAIGSTASYNRHMPEFRILGPLEVLTDDGDEIEFGGAKPRGLLVLLLLRANKIVTTDFLVDALWGEHPPPAARAALQNSVAALRKRL